MIVQKYGGSSVATIDHMKTVAKRVVSRIQTDGPLVVVVSAMGTTTNDLLSLAHHAASNPSARELDMLLATGEQVSSSLLTMMIKDHGYDAIALNGSQAGIQTMGIYSKNKIKTIDIDGLQNHLNQNRTVVVTGFQGVNEQGDVTTLGRGGSDTSAVALAASLNVPCEIYTDVNGIYSVDPRRYASAQKLTAITYEEMSELAALGANVMEARAVELAQKYNVPLTVAKAHAWETGTVIKEQSPMLEKRTITGVSVIDDIIMVSLDNLNNPTQDVARLFRALSAREINVDMISQTYVNPSTLSVSFSCNADDLKDVQKALEVFNQDVPSATIRFDESLSKLSAVGLGMRTQAGVAATLFDLLAKADVPFKLVTTSDISISYAIPKEKTKDAVNTIARAFEL